MPRDVVRRTGRRFRTPVTAWTPLFLFLCASPAVSDWPTLHPAIPVGTEDDDRGSGLPASTMPPDEQLTRSACTRSAPPTRAQAQRTVAPSLLDKLYVFVRGLLSWPFGARGGQS